MLQCGPRTRTQTLIPRLHDRANVEQTSSKFHQACLQRYAYCGPVRRSAEFCADANWRGSSRSKSSNWCGLKISGSAHLCLLDVCL